MNENNYIRKYKYVEGTSSFSYNIGEFDAYETSIKLLNGLVNRGVKINRISAIETTESWEGPSIYNYYSIDEFMQNIEQLKSNSIDKIVNYCTENGVDFEVHVMPSFSRVDIIFRHYEKENDDSVDEFIQDSIIKR